MICVYFLVLLALPGPLHQGFVTAMCSEVSQLGPENAILNLHFKGMNMGKIIPFGVRP